MMETKSTAIHPKHILLPPPPVGAHSLAFTQLSTQCHIIYSIQQQPLQK